MKKLIPFLCALTISSLAFANSQTNEDYFSGFYLGLGIGTTYLSSTVDTTYQGTNNTYTFNESPNLIGIATTTYAGYGAVFQQHYYVGAEAYFHITPLSYDTSQQKTQGDLSVKHTLSIKDHGSIGLALRGGYLFTPKTMLYLSLAADHGGADVNTTTEGTQHTIFGPFPTFSTENNVRENYLPLVPGIGFEAILTKKLGIRIQDTVYFYKNKNKITDTVTSDTTKMFGNTLTISLQYRFNQL